MRIAAIEKGSPAEALGLRVDDSIISINGEPVRDELDLRFHLADDRLRFVIERPDSERRDLVYEGEGFDTGFGIALEETKVRLCGNDCVFCFVDQSPKGMRKGVYVRDEDYRLSFLYGNFITLTNLKEWEMQRIITQRLSPLYISVHSLDLEIRERLFATARAREILPRIERLLDADITLHTQVVVCPGYNDGDDLERTLAGLAELIPRGVESLAIVPVGLTGHREGLPRLEPVTPGIAATILDMVKPWSKRLRERYGFGFVHLADEFYRLLQRDPPPHEEYDGYPQLDDGIGLTRHFMHQMEQQGKQTLEALRAEGVHRATLVTGVLFAPTMEREMRRYGAEVPALALDSVTIRNDFYGHTVTVAGLLVGRDVERQLRDRDLGDRVCLPPACLDESGRFLDDVTLPELGERLGVPVVSGFGLETEV